MHDVVIRAIESDAEIRAAAKIMADADPWRRAGRTFDNTYECVANPQAEKLVAIVDEKVVGIVVIGIAIPLIKGYIIALAVHEEYRSRGIGRKLLLAAEDRIHRDSPNVFLCVSSFNHDARRFYERMGYKPIGELPEYAIRGASETLMWKSRGPWSEFKKAASAQAS